MRLTQLKTTWSQIRCVISLALSVQTPLSLSSQISGYSGVGMGHGRGRPIKMDARSKMISQRLNDRDDR